MSLVVLARYLSLPEAHAAAGALRAAGLTPTVMDANYGSVQPFEQVMLQGFRLAVPADQVDQAFDILKTDHRAAPDGAAAEDDDAWDDSFDWRAAAAAENAEIDARRREDRRTGPMTPTRLVLLAVFVGLVGSALVGVLRALGKM